MSNEVELNDVEIWILARLFNDVCMDNKELLRELCDASFDMIQKASDYDAILEKLQETKYIEKVTKTIEDFKEVDGIIPLQKELKPITRKISGFEITTEGIIVYRRKLITPFQKMKPHFSKINNEVTEAAYKKVINKLNSSDIATVVIKECIENAPRINEILKIILEWAVNNNIPLT